MPEKNKQTKQENEEEEILTNNKKEENKQINETNIRKEYPPNISTKMKHVLQN